MTSGFASRPWGPWPPGCAGGGRPRLRPGPLRPRSSRAIGATPVPSAAASWWSARGIREPCTSARAGASRGERTMGLEVRARSERVRADTRVSRPVQTSGTIGTSVPKNRHIPSTSTRSNRSRERLGHDWERLGTARGEAPRSSLGRPSPHPVRIFGRGRRHPLRSRVNPLQVRSRVKMGQNQPFPVVPTRSRNGPPTVPVP